MLRRARPSRLGSTAPLSGDHGALCKTRCNDDNARLVHPTNQDLMPLSICTACGTQYPESASTPAQCLICEEERQYVPPGGQTWTTLAALSKSHMNGFHEYDTGIIGIGSQPSFAIGQRALLVRTDGGTCLVGLHCHARRGDHRHDQGAWRPEGHRNFASAFLHNDGGMGARIRLPDPSPCRRQRLDHTRRTARSSCGTAIRSGSGMASLWSVVAGIFRAAP